jgi:hypothetical protein
MCATRPVVHCFGAESDCAKRTQIPKNAHKSRNNRKIQHIYCATSMAWPLSLRLTRHLMSESATFALYQNIQERRRETNPFAPPIHVHITIAFTIFYDKFRANYSARRTAKRTHSNPQQFKLPNPLLRSSSILRTQHSALSTQSSALSPQSSVLESAPPKCSTWNIAVPQAREG